MNLIVSLIAAVECKVFEQNFLNNSSLKISDKQEIASTANSERSPRKKVCFF